MSYTPNPTDATNPTDLIAAGTAAAEFRALKAYLQQVLGTGGPGGFNTSSNNVIIGGDFDTNPWQRGVTFSTPIDDQTTADMWKCSINDLASAGFTVFQDADAPSVTLSGVFGTTCLGITVTTPITTLPADSYFAFKQPIEGYSFKYLMGQQSVISFWHKHTVAGTYYIALRNSGRDQVLTAPYTQNTGGAWEYATIEIPPTNPSVGTWNFTDGLGCTLLFCLAVGTGSQETNSANLGTWQTGGGAGTNYMAFSDQVNFLGTTGNGFAIALVQWQGGFAATRFAYRGAIQTLSDCLRYYEQDVNSGGGLLFNADVTSGTTYTANQQFLVTKRANPTIVESNQAASNFAATIGSINAKTIGFSDGRAATGTGPGFFHANWTADAEIANA